MDTIRCPRVLKMLNHQLPERQYEEKKPKTLKLIAEDNERPQNNSSRAGDSRSLKKIGSEKSIRAYSIGKNRYIDQHNGQN